MTIDGINIASLGLHLSYLDGHLNQPARKNTLQEWSFSAKDLVFDSKEPVVDLVGYYGNKATLLTAMLTFTDILTSQPVHAFDFGGHGVVVSGVIVDGVRVETIKTMVKINFKVKVIE